MGRPQSTKVYPFFSSSLLVALGPQMRLAYEVKSGVWNVVTFYILSFQFETDACDDYGFE